MIKVIVFYLVRWRFTKLENKKLIIVRAILASVLAVFFLMGAITISYQKRRLCLYGYFWAHTVYIVHYKSNF